MDIIQCLKDEHQKVMTMIKRYETLDSAAAKHQVVVQLIPALSAHETAEETAVYPQLRKLIPDMAVIEAAIREQGELKGVLKQLSAHTTEQEMETQMMQLKKLVTAHVATEENRLLPLVKQHCDQAMCEKLGNDFINAKTHEIEQMAQLNITMMPEAGVEMKQKT
jgi:hemerythrin superfamily protein